MAATDNMTEEQAVARIVAYFRRCAQDADHPELIEAAKKTEAWRQARSEEARFHFLTDYIMTMREFFGHAAKAIENGEWKEGA